MQKYRLSEKPVKWLETGGLKIVPCILHWNPARCAQEPQARIPKVVIGSRNPKAGCAGSILDLLHVPAFNHQVELEEGVLQEECSEMLTSFFRELRKKKKQASEKG